MKDQTPEGLIDKILDDCANECGKAWEAYDGAELDDLDEYGDLYDAAWSKSKQALLALVKTEVEKTKVAFAKDMLEMDKWNEKARTDELHKIIRQSAEKQRLNEREDR